MTVYIEYVLIDNFVIDYFLLSAAFTITGKREKVLYRIIAAATGAIAALIYPLFSDMSVLSIILKIATGLTVVFAAGRYSSIKEYYVNAAVFFALTFALGGAVIGVFSIFNLDYSSETSIAFMAIPAYTIVKTIKSIVKYFFIRAVEEKNCYDCEITLNQTTVKLKGFMDTGNSLYDGDSPVVVCGEKVALKIIGDRFPKIKHIKIKTAIGEKKVLSFKVDQIKIFISDKANIFNNVTVASVKNAGQGYDIILHPALKEKSYERNIAS